MDRWTTVIGAAALLGLALVLLLLERLFPLRERKRRFGPRLGKNVVVTALGLGTAALTVSPTVTQLVQWTSQRRFGLLHLVELPPLVHAAAAFLLLDLTFYYWHRATHTVPLLWRLHNVHHVDPDMDVSTAFRFHFCEIFVSTAFRGLQVLLIGVSLGTVVVFQAVFMAETLFHHSNLRLPARLERWVSRVFITPRVHGVHHSIYRDETNSNYGSIFIWWDRIHRSICLNVPQEKVTIGVAGYQEREDNRLLHLILLPFKRQKAYWKWRGREYAHRAEDDTGDPATLEP